MSVSGSYPPRGVPGDGWEYQPDDVAAVQRLRDWTCWLSDQDGLGDVVLDENTAKRLRRDLEAILEWCA